MKKTNHDARHGDQMSQATELSEAVALFRDVLERTVLKVMAPLLAAMDAQAAAGAERIASNRELVAAITAYGEKFRVFGDCITALTEELRARDSSSPSSHQSRRPS